MELNEMSGELIFCPTILKMDGTKETHHIEFLSFSTIQTKPLGRGTKWESENWKLDSQSGIYLTVVINN